MQGNKPQAVGPQLSIVIPAYNEERRIVPTLTHTLEYLSGLDQHSEVLVVSDGSTDRTMEVVQAFEPSTRRVLVRALEYQPNRGKGYAVQYGMLQAKGRQVLFMDADYAVPIGEMEKARRLLDKGFDIAIGSRALKGAQISTKQNLPRELSAKIYTIIQNIYLGLSFPDTQCGFKMFTRQAAQDLFARQKLTSVIFDAEILWLAKMRGFQVGQFPVTWRHVGDSRIVYDSLAKSLFIFKELFRIRGLHSQRL